MNLTQVKSITLPEGKVRSITACGVVIWQADEAAETETDESE